MFDRVQRWMQKPASEKLNAVIYNYRALRLALMFRTRNPEFLTARLPWCVMKVKSDWLGRNIYLGSYEKKELMMIARIGNPEWVALDIGANIGYYTLFLEKRVGCRMVYAFEPSPREFSLLKENLASNGCTHVKPFNLALGERETVIKLYLSSDNIGKNSINFFESSDQEITVPVIQADALLNTEQLRRVDFIKLDVEGAEPMVLRGASELIRKFKPVILYESWEFSKAPYGSFACETTSLIESFGYRIFDTDQKGRLIPIRKGDYIRSENAVAISSDRLDAFSAHIRGR